MSDHYQTLGIPRDAAQDTISRAWREAASLYHPDRGGDAEKFRAARTAYETLTDREKRAAYDATLTGVASGILACVSSTDFANARELAPWLNSETVCPFCDGMREVRVGAAGFWIRKACPVCTKAEGS